MMTTGQICDVSGFYSDFDAIKDIPVETVATAYRVEWGKVYVLIIHEAYGTTVYQCVTTFLTP